MALSCKARRFVIAVCVAMVVSVAAPHVALAKSFTVEDVAIGGQVSPSGALTISEKRTVDFDGDFSRLFWTLDKTGAESIEILSVTDESGTMYVRTDDPATLETRPPNTYLVQDSGSTLSVHAFHRSADQRRTFTLDYRVIGAAKRWADTGELYWKLLGDQWEVETAHFSAVLGVEGVTSKDQMQAWAHGPLTGTVTIADNGEVTLEASDVPANTFVEVRMLFPPDVLAQAPKMAVDRKQSALAEEARWAEEANRERRSAQLTMALWTAIPTIGALIALVIGVMSFLRHGKEHRAQFSGRYFREDPRPDLHPAVVGTLWKFGQVEDNAISATLMNLADKGVIVMTPKMVQKPGLGGLFGRDEQSFLLQRVPEMRSKETPLDTELLDLLFNKVAAGSQELELGEIETYAKSHPESFTSDVKGWKDSAKIIADQMGFFEGESWSWQIGIFLAAGFVAALGWFGVAQTGSPLPVCLPIPVVIALVVIGVFMRRRSQQGNELFRMYEGVRNYLKDFSRLEEAPPSSVVLWNRFLVLAVLFGVAEEVIE